MIDQQPSDAPTQSSAVQLLLTKSVIRTVVGILVTLSVALLLQIYFSPSHTPDPTLLNMLSLVIGVIVGCYGQAFNWSFGSSPQSKAKDQAIAALANKVPQKEPLKVDVVGTPDNPPDDKP